MSLVLSSLLSCVHAQSLRSCHVAMPSSSGSSWSRDRTYVSCIAGGFFTTESRGKPVEMRNMAGTQLWDPIVVISPTNSTKFGLLCHWFPIACARGLSTGRGEEVSNHVTVWILETDKPSETCHSGHQGEPWFRGSQGTHGGWVLEWSMAWWLQFNWME